MTRLVRSLAAHLALALPLALLACNSSSGGSTTGTGGAGGGGTGGAGGSGSVSACPNPPSLTAASPTCNTVTNGAAKVPFTAGTGTPPTPAGGAIMDGVYYATQASGYGSATPAGRQLTIVILDNATQMLWAGAVLDATGTSTSLSFTANATASVSGTQISMTTTCMSTSTSPLPPALEYTASGNQLILSLASNGATSVTTYTRQGCP